MSRSIYRLTSLSFALSLLLFSECASAASPFDGQWQITYSCKGSTGVYAERCKNGDRDRFFLELWSSNSYLCGTHLATAHLGNRVDETGSSDEPSIQGRLNKGVVIVNFESNWGGKGTAAIRVKGATLDWKVIEQGAETSWLPQHAVLSRTQGKHAADHPPCQE